MLFHLLLSEDEVANKDCIFNKASEILTTANYEAVIDSAENFQLVVIDYLDSNSFNDDAITG